MQRSPNRIQVAYVINDLLFGGAQQVVLALATGLDRDRFEPIVYYLNDYPPERHSLAGRFEEAGIPLRYVGTRGKTSIAKAVPRLRHLFRQERPDVVHTHLADASLAGVVAARLAGIRRIVIHEHQTHEHYSWRIRRGFRIIRRLAALTICYSPLVEEELFGEAVTLTVPPETLTRPSYTIRNGITATRGQERRSSVRDELGIPRDALLVISVTRLVEWKGARNLLEAAGLLGASLPDLYVCFVGEGPLAPELSARAAELGIADRVRMLGTRADVPDLLGASDIASLVFQYEPGVRGEAVGIAGLEAMAAGLPLIAAETSDPHALVRDQETGLLIPAGDAQALAQAIARLAADPALREAIGKRAGSFARAFEWPTLLPIYEGLYTLLIRS